ncbi:MAG: glycosyltransferase [Phycisphaerales bacterium]|nr:glycosyltransferase [Phycisphaerales bacterium]
MLADRTEDHLASFEEDKEAVFFSSTEEMVDKAKYYLKNDEARERIAQAGYRRCLESGYSNYDRARLMLQEALAATSSHEAFVKTP